MTKIENNDFKVKVVAKKAPAKKAPATAEKEWKEIKELHTQKENNDVGVFEGGTENYQEAEEREATMTRQIMEQDNAITTLQRNADAQKQLISSVNEKNQKLQDKLTFVNDANCTIMFPNHLIESIINKQIEKVNNKLMASIDDANDVIEQLTSEDIKDALDQVNRINDLKSRVCDVEDTINNSNLDDLDYEIESQVDGILDYKEYVIESEVEGIVEEVLNCREYVERDDLHEDLKIYGREINELKSRLDNTLYNKICRLVKNIFSYNLSNKVRSIFKRNKNKAVIETKWSSSFKERIANRMKASKK